MKQKLFKFLAVAAAGLVAGFSLFACQYSGQPSVNSSGNIKWVDFNVTYEALKETMELDILTYDQQPHISWIDSLAYLGAKYGGDFSQYDKEDLNPFVSHLQSGKKPEDFTKDYKYFPYYKKAYGAVLNGILGYFKREVPDEDGSGETHWVEQYGLKGFFPLAEGYHYTHADDFGLPRSYGYSRKHLGHDLAADTGTPVVAAEGGIIEAIGWNQYGGWRIGIRSFDKERYYYYAHLRKDHPYAENLYVGQSITAGQVIGYVGQTGYSLKENTNNIDTPHLHFGMQLVLDEEVKDSPNQVWIDLYALTKLLSHHTSEVVPDGEEYVRRYQFSEESYYLASAKEEPQQTESREEIQDPRQQVRLPALMYHSLLKDPAMQNRYVISPALFEQDLKYLKKHGYTSVLMSDLIGYVENGAPLPEKPVLITFDDGYYNNYLYAFPLLKKYQMKAVISIIGKETDKDSRSGGGHATYSSLTWEQVQEMSASGLVEIQNHSYNSHRSAGKRTGVRRKPGESRQEYEAFLEKDLSKLQQKTEDVTGVAPSTFTYPFGAVSRSSLKTIRELGFKASLGCEEGINIIKKGDPGCLYFMKRCLRAPEKSSARFFETMGKK